MSHIRMSYLKIHFAVFLFGITGLFGKYLLLSPFIIVLGRVFFSMLFMGSWLGLKKESFRLSDKKDYTRLALMGVLLALHWITFFGSIQMTTVAVGLLTFSTFPVFVCLLSPLLKAGPIRKKDLVFGIFTMVGVLFIVPLDNLGSHQALGALVGIVSGGLYAVFTTINERLVQSLPTKKVAFYEQLFATILLMPSLMIFKPTFTLRDIFLLILLGTIFTGIGHTLFIGGLTHVRAYLAAMITMLEPLYGISLAFITLGEVPSIKTLIGGSIILSTVLILSLSGQSAST